jgi:hypothetical protein
MDTRRIALTLSAAAGGLAVAALLPLATANADPITYGFSPDMPGSVQDISVGGLAPFDQTLEESGLFDVTQSGFATLQLDGLLSNYVDIFGIHNQEFLVTSNNIFTVPEGTVIDQLSFGSGIENVYVDTVGTAAGGGNTITDTLITPFGDFNIPVAFDAAAIADPATFAAAVDPAASTDFLAGLASLF